MRWDLTADQLAWLPTKCWGCKKPLAESARQLELDSRDWTYHDFRDVPEDRSQGWFPFCQECAGGEVEGASRKRGLAPQPKP